VLELTDERLMSKTDVMIRVGVSFPTIWKWMLEGKFPRARALGGVKTCWLASEVESWLANLPIQPIKGEKNSGFRHQQRKTGKKQRSAGRREARVEA
jgi:predicted DNA-binding transcriptional regulator AlpA